MPWLKQKTMADSSVSVLLRRIPLTLKNKVESQFQNSTDEVQVYMARYGDGGWGLVLQYRIIAIYIFEWAKIYTRV